MNSRYYIQRPGEENFIRRIEEPGSLLRIRGPRQFGKTSLLARVISHARTQSYTVIKIDFQDFSESTLSDLDTFLFEFCYFFAEELSLEDQLEKRWSKQRDAKRKAKSFLAIDVLRQVDMPILLALDEADRIFSYENVSTDFFLMLRSWHESSKTQEDWELLRQAISYSTEARLAITNLNASPFNVGEEAHLSPFNAIQIAGLGTATWAPNEGERY